MDRSSKAAIVFLVLFALPFCGFGLGALISGLHQVASGGPAQMWGLVFLGLVFSAIGFGLLALAVLGPHKMKQVNRRQAENPGQPWLWQEDWAQGRANSKTESGMIGAWIFAIFWNLVSVPILFIVPHEQFQREPKTLIALIFPAIGIALLIRAIRETLRFFEFGKTY